MSNQSHTPRWHTAFKSAACISTLAALLALANTARAQVEYETFDSGTLNPAVWSHIADPTYPNTITFVPDVFGGKAIRLQGSPPSNATATVHNGFTTARCLAVNTANIYTNCYVAADIVKWDTDPYHATNYSFNGVMARISGDPTSGTNWSGIALMYWINLDTQEGPPAAPGVGAITMGYINHGYLNLDATLPQTIGGIAPAAVAYWTLEPGHSYRLVLQGVGRNLTGTVYDVQDLTKPLGTLLGDTSVGFLQQSGQHITVPAPTNGWSGLFAATFDRSDTTGEVDATFDNFYAAELPPTSVSAPATPHGMIGAPQVINRTPASWANFYNPAGGISFTATTLTTTNNLTTSAIRLILNGVDVTSGCVITPATPPTSATVTFSGLATNTVYDASIILEDSSNRWTTNVWTFDTFSAAYLASASCLNVECEDYDFDGAGLDPVPTSGYSTNDNTWMTPPGASGPLGYFDGINIANYGGSGSAQVGYVGINGTKAATNNAGPGQGDYYQCTRTAPLVGAPANILSLIQGGSIDLNSLIPACEYRTGGAPSWPNFLGAGGGDMVGTERGAAYAVSLINLDQNGGALTYDYTFDTKRQKYADLNAAGLAQYPIADGYNPKGFYGATGADAAPWWDVQEYNVVYTEGSDWLNYTHDWGSSQSYLVYLRNACSGSQTANLYSGATTNRVSLLGTFSTTNALAWNWRFTPLRDASGNPKVVTLSGTSTLRLEMAPDNPEWVSVRNGLALNYLALVPASQCQVTIGPAAAVTAGAQWQLDGGGWQNSAASVGALPGLNTVSFKPVLHWTPPANQNVNVTAGQTTAATGTYTALPLTLWSTTVLKKSGTAWTQETGATVDYTNLRVTNAAPTVATYYQLRWDTQTAVTRVSKSGSKVILNFITTEQPGLNVRAWKGGANTNGGPIDGVEFNLVGPSPAPDDSSANDATYFPGGLGTIGYATQSINMPNAGPQEHFTAIDGCGVAAPGPFPTGYSLNYSVEYRGQLYIAAAGSYSFATASDDGSAIWLDAGTDNPTYSQAIVQNNYSQGLTTRSTASPLALTAGFHEIIVRFNQGGGQNALQLYWDPTGGTSWVPIPGSLFYHKASQ